MSWKVWAAVCVAAAGALVASCSTAGEPQNLRPEFESKDRGVTSRYFRPKGTGKTYAYGNFCGPGLPVAEGNPANLREAAAVKPVDTIDRACKLHDMCYMKFGRDNPQCDQLTYASGLSLKFPNLGSPLNEQCGRLIGEVGQGIMIKATGGVSLASDAAIGAAVAPLGAATDLLLGGLGMLSGVDNMGGERPPRNFGFPKEPGHCNATYGAAESYVGFTAFPFGLEGISLDKTELAEVSTVESLHYEMVCLAELSAAKGTHDCDRIWDAAYKGAAGREAYYSFPAADVQHFLDTGDIRAMPNDQIRRLRQAHPLIARYAVLKR